MSTTAISTAYQRRLDAIADTSVGGRAFCHQLATATDRWLVELFESAITQTEGAPDVALVAVGGYGRGDLSPHSDIDVVLVVDGTLDGIEPLASAIWYPIWDAGVKLGHAVRRLSDQLTLARSDLDTATAVLTARHLAGNPQISDKIRSNGETNWYRHRRRWLDQLHRRVLERQANAGDVAYILEPDLKDGHGGIRDAHSIWWAQAGGLELADDDNRLLNDSYDVLLDARVALHRATDRPGDVLRLDLQDAAADAAGVDADELMAQIASAARSVAWLSDEQWSRLNKTTGGAPSEVAPGVMVIDGEVELAVDANPAVDPTYVLRIATAAARRRLRIGRRSLERLAELVPDWPRRWPVGAIDRLVALLLEGHAAIPVIESLDQASLITRMLPEWEPNRSRPQRNAYHRFTVDRHLWETAANAAELVDMVSRPDLLVLGALFHDIGKGYPGDHTEVGMEMVAEMGPRLGLNVHDTAVLVAMVEHHLLLPDAATRRDVSDPATIELVAEAAGSLEVLELLHALTIADSKATGPSAWSGWKEELVADLVTRASYVVRGGDVADAAWTLFPDADTLAVMATGESAVEVRSDDHVIVVYHDLPGAFHRIAGAMSLHGIDVVAARVHSDERQLGRVAMGAAELRIELGDHGVDWERVVPDIERALDGQLAIDARIAERVRAYRHRERPSQAAEPVAPSISFDDQASTTATVIEVRGPTRTGFLHAVTRALASTGCDLRHATVQTVGMNALDSFYVRDWNDQLITDPHHRAEIERAVMHALNRLVEQS